jgi:hypothetical protein
MKNLKLKIICIEHYGTCTAAARATGGQLHPSTLSRIVSGHRVPTTKDREALKKIFTPEQIQRVLVDD